MIDPEHELPIIRQTEILQISRSSVYYTEFYGKPCVVKLRDGRALLKTLRAGRTAGLYTLTSYNASDIEDAQVEWAARIVFVKIT